MVNTEWKNSSFYLYMSDLSTLNHTSLRDLYQSITDLLSHLDFVSVSHKGLQSKYHSVMGRVPAKVRCEKYKHWEYTGEI